MLDHAKAKEDREESRQAAKAAKRRRNLGTSRFSWRLRGLAALPRVVRRAVTSAEAGASLTLRAVAGLAPAASVGDGRRSLRGNVRPRVASDDGKAAPDQALDVDEERALLAVAKRDGS